MRKLLALCLSLGLGACASPKVPARSTAAPATATPAPAQEATGSPADAASQEAQQPQAVTLPPITVTLIDPGEEPRAPLRIRPQSGQSFTVTQRTHTNVSTVINGQPVAQATLPVVVQTITYKTTQVSPERVTYTWSASLEAQGGPGVEPSALAKMQAQLANAKEVTGQSVFDLRGVLLENRIDQQDPNLSAAFSHLWSPFPIEAVGAGASWRTEQTKKINGFDATLSTVYAIESIQGGVVVTSADSNTQGSPGPFHHPDLPPGATIDLKSMNGSSSKSTTIRDLAFFQDKSEENAQLTTVLNMKNNGQSQEIVTETTLKVVSETAAANPVR